jgi:hypothetical protein
MRNPQQPGIHSRDEVELKDQEFRNAIGHEHQVGEALQARRASGYKVRWSVAWGQLVSWLLVAAIFAGIILLLLHEGSGH